MNVVNFLNALGCIVNHRHYISGSIRNIETAISTYYLKGHSLSHKEQI